LRYSLSPVTRNIKIQQDLDYNAVIKIAQAEKVWFFTKLSTGFFHIPFPEKTFIYKDKSPILIKNTSISKKTDLCDIINFI
jgi:hypothetical protein